jgi:hypothetical protein
MAIGLRSSEAVISLGGCKNNLGDGPARQAKPISIRGSPGVLPVRHLRDPRIGSVTKSAAGCLVDLRAQSAETAGVSSPSNWAAPRGTTRNKKRSPVHSSVATRPAGRPGEPARARWPMSWDSQPGARGRVDGFTTIEAASGIGIGIGLRYRGGPTSLKRGLRASRRCAPSYRPWVVDPGGRQSRPGGVIWMGLRHAEGGRMTVRT